MFTGVDIHPAAQIGARFIVGHGVGIVIGEDVRVGDDCIIQQCVTLGQLTLDAGDKGGRFQPTLGNRVHVGANAVLLGPITIGDDAKIGAGAVVLCDVPAGCTAVGNPARVLPPKGEHADASR